MNRRMLAAMIAGVVATTSVAACGATAGTATVAGTETTGTNATSPSDSSSGSNSAASDDAGTLFDSSTVHSIAIDYDQAAYDAMIATYQSTGEKEWISATVTIDGTVFENVGIKLKGNSSLAGLGGQGGPAGGPSTTGDDSGTTTPDATDEIPDVTGETPDATGEIPDAAATEEPSADGEAPRDRVMNGAGASADEPESLPWRIKLDEYVEGQNYQGETDIVVRANNSETSLNEAVALELIAAAGMASEAAAPVRFSVNGGTEQLRLVVENPNDDWYAENVGVTGILYKAEAGGDYSYRGDDPTAYEDVFDVEANTTGSDSDEYAPLIAFLKWLNESDDAAFAAELDQYLDIDSFADYLAIQDLIENFDDIEGPGNNSYLSYDASTGLFTVISWDHNLAFGGLGGGMRTFADARWRHTTHRCRAGAGRRHSTHRCRAGAGRRHTAHRCRAGAGRRDRVDPTYRRRSAPGDGRAAVRRSARDRAERRRPGRRRARDGQRPRRKVPCQRGLRCTRGAGTRRPAGVALRQRHRRADSRRVDGGAQGAGDRPRPRRHDRHRGGPDLADHLRLTPIR